MNYVRQLKQVALGGVLLVFVAGCAANAGGQLGNGMFSASCMQSSNQYYGSYRWAINHLIVGTEVQHTIIQHAAETAPIGTWAGNNLDISGLTKVDSPRGNYQQWALKKDNIDFNANVLVTQRSTSASAQRAAMLVSLTVFDHCSPVGREYTTQIFAVKDANTSIWIPQFDPNSYGRWLW